MGPIDSLPKESAFRLCGFSLTVGSLIAVWTFHAVEEDKVARSAEALEHAGIRRRRTFLAEQRFRDYDELVTKVGAQGSVAIKRAQRFNGMTDFVTPMSYGLALF